MIEVRRGADRFCTRTGWLTSWHSFSYGQWYDAGNVGFGRLVVSNHDLLEPGGGFEAHRHRGVDLVTYVVSGALEHADSDGQLATLGAGQLQVLHAGGGVVHSERNASATEPVEYVQMWLTSDGVGSSYQRAASPCVLAGGVLAVVDLADGESWQLDAPMAHVYLVSGEVSTGAGRLMAGDAVRLWQEPLAVTAQTHSTLLAWTLRKP